MTLFKEILENRIPRSVMRNIEWWTKKLFSSKNDTLSVKSGSIPELLRNLREKTKQQKPLPYLTSRLREYHNQLKKLGGPRVRSKTDARMLSKHLEHNIILLDVDKDTILTISAPEIRETIELIYNPPCLAYSGGHFDAIVEGEIGKVPNNDFEVYDLLHSAIKVAMGDTYSIGKSQDEFNRFINDHPSNAGEIFTRDAHAFQLKRGRALLRIDMNQCSRQCELDFSHLPSCIESALKSEKVSQLAKVLAEYESESRSAEANSSEHGTVVMTTQVSRDACLLFMSSGSSVEAEFYRKLVVEKINDDDITTAIKLCCIGHQIPFYRDNMNRILQISDAQTLRDTLERMLKMESYEQERSKFLSICDEWHIFLEPRGLMNIEQRELLREWISTRQYADTEDPVVSLVIQKCSKHKNEDAARKRNWRTKLHTCPKCILI